MHFNAFTKLIAPYHQAQLIAAYATESGIQAQISTGLIDFPFIAVNDSIVTKEDVYEVLDMYDNQQFELEQEQEASFSSALNNLPTPESCCWGLQAV